jgi:phosphoglycerate kinase
MVFTFLKAIGNNIGRSLLEKDKIDIANEILNRGKEKIILPNDIVVVDDITNPTYILTKFLDQIDEKDIGVDIGKETINKFSEIVSHSKTIIFNGPMGIFEDERYERGTKKIIEAMTKVKGTTIVGGGDSAAAVKKFKMENKINHISTGGGASLELLSGNNLPGICALEEK